MKAFVRGERFFKERLSTLEVKELRSGAAHNIITIYFGYSHSPRSSSTPTSGCLICASLKLIEGPNNWVIKHKTMDTMDHSHEGFSSSDDMQEPSSDDADYGSFIVPTKQEGAPLKSCFKRRNSMTAESTTDDEGHMSSSELPTDQPVNEHTKPSEHKQPPEIIDPSASGITTRICGPSRSKCGYCSGSRLHVLQVDDGHNIVCPLKDKSKPYIWSNPDLENVDEESSSKSYGLLFDYLPYDTYQELIDRGWRRSGKHLYRPHNFERWDKCPFYCVCCYFQLLYYLSQHCEMFAAVVQQSVYGLIQRNSLLATWTRIKVK
jgi:hypothetical protein